ncbi:MAG: fibronectin type III domain-containing protein [Pirellulales bacterium]
MNGRSFGFWQTWQARPRNKRQPTPRRALKSGRLERLESRELLTVTYNGGALLTNVEAQAVYLGSAWNTNTSLQSQAQATDQFLSTLVSGSYMNMLSSYNVGTGTDTKGVVDNVNLSANSTLSDSQIQTDLAGTINSKQAQAPNANNLYVVYVEPGVVVSDGSATSQNSFLGYHGAFSDNGTDIHYAVITYPGSPNPTPQSQGFQSSFDEQTSVTSHEVAEAVTDPNVNYKTLGWYDFQLNGEIADLAEGHESTITGANGVQYVVQDVVNQNDQVITPGSGSTGGGNTGGGGTTGGGGVGTMPSPTLQVSAVSSTVAQLKWNLVSGAAGYNVYLMNGGSQQYLGTVSASTSSVDVTGLKAGSTDSFMVEAANQAGAIGDSAIVSVTLPAPVVPTAVTAPSVTATAASSTSVVLNWTAEPQATGYNIYWSNGYQVVFLGTVGGSTSSVTVTGLRAGSSSYFLVEAFNNVSYADSPWVYVATPYASFGGGSAYGWYAEQRSNGFFGGAPSMFANQSSGQHGRERY